jgi:hypothetical protein
MEVLVEERGKERSSTNDPAVKAATRRSALSQVYICRSSNVGEILKGRCHEIFDFRFFS